MARYRIVIADADLAHRQEIARNVDANVAVHGEGARPKLHAHFSKMFQPRPVGHVHDEVDDTCPDGRPNCRHCGDPAYAEACRAAGHCPHCGTRHGLAPDAVVAANGYRVERVV